MTAAGDIFEQIKIFLPKYLTPKQTTELFAELSRFPDNKSFYLEGAEFRSQLLQGDGWRGFVAIEFTTGTRKSVSGVIISNSCDISAANPRALPPNVLFAPLIRLERLRERLRAAGKTDEQVLDMIRDIRKQRVTSLFYFPERVGTIEESVILLDDIHRHPLSDFLGRERTKLFTLHQVAFYILLMKLSIHFSRFNEGIQRFPDSA